MVDIGLIFPPHQPPERLRDTALAAETAGLDDLWVWEDCFAESGIASSAIALESTSTITVGLGLMPTPFRNVALTAMEVATLARIYPGRFVPGIGHGVLDWMGQIGARARSPLTLLDEYATALRALLHGDEVTTKGQYVSLDAVRLQWPPLDVPPLLIGGRGPKTIALAGRLADGIILAAPTPLDEQRTTVRIAEDARRAAGITEPLQVVNFVEATIDMSRDQLHDLIAERADAGTTTVAVCVLEEQGPPIADDRILDFAGRLADAR